MARYTDAELETIKRTVDLVALIQSKGIQLQNHGSKDLKGLCPFHADQHPSLIISPTKNLWHCPSCNKGGDVIRFVQNYDGVSFRHAVEFLRNGNLAEVLTRSEQKKQSTVPKLKTPVELNVEDHRQASPCHRLLSPMLSRQRGVPKLPEETRVGASRSGEAVQDRLCRS